VALAAISRNSSTQSCVCPAAAAGKLAPTVHDFDANAKAPVKQNQV